MTDDPLAALLEWAEDEGEPGAACDDEAVAEVRRGLEALERMLEAPGGRLSSERLRALHGLSQFSPPTRLPPALGERAERAARRLWPAAGPAKGFVEEALLLHVACGARPSSLPFFRDAIAFAKDRDALAPRRRRYALAGVAFLARGEGDPGANELLSSLLIHEDVRVRAWAVDAVARVRREGAGALRADAARELALVARSDRAFEPRFLARAWLAAEGRPLPAERPGGAYAFKAACGKAARVVELRSEQTLDELARALAAAFGRGADRLYQFRLSGALAEPAFRLTAEAAGWGADEGPPDGVGLALGELGLTPEHRFGLLYDFGEQSLFQLKVVAIHPRADAGASYPRVLAGPARAPAP